MKNKMAAFLLLILLAGTPFSQGAKRPAEGTLKLKTVRLHIDGFMKSKSGAI